MKLRKTLSAAEVDALWGELDRKLHGIGLQTQPEVAAKVVSLVSNPDAGLRQYADVIKTDPSLAGRLLRLANSAFFAQRQPVTNLDRACVLLGLERLKAVAMGFYLSRAASTGDAFARRIWGEGVYRACLASELSRQLCPGYAPEAFCIGLMLDAGIPILCKSLGQPAQAIYTAMESPAKQFKAEFDSLAFTHVDVAAVLARRWRLPDLLAKPIERHHVMPPEGGRPDPIYLLHRVAYYVGSIQLTAACTPQQSVPLPMTAQKVLGVSPDQLEAIVRKAGSEYSALSEMFREVADCVGDVNEMADRVQQQLVDLMDQNMMSEFRAQSRDSCGSFDVADQKIEIEVDGDGLAVAYLLDAEGTRFLSHTFKPTSEDATSVLESLGVEEPPHQAVTEIDDYLRTIAA
jgi:HD-like signal output (HDOD) protein